MTPSSSPLVRGRTRFPPLLRLSITQKSLKCLLFGTLIVRTSGFCGGRPRIAGHRITVHNIAIDFNAGRKPEEIIDERPQLTLAQVYSALAYYYANKEAIDAEIRSDIEEYDRLEAEYGAKL
ncbi:MAG: DUF433 domain-containing protein [Symploca sp. SIO2C1]|nr:DUF433 domain-containing protein [Symploca sp. SIO2C1]